MPMDPPFMPMDPPFMPMDPPLHAMIVSHDCALAVVPRWKDAVVWSPYLTMEACYKDFVCVENAQVRPSATPSHKKKQPHAPSHRGSLLFFFFAVRVVAACLHLPPYPLAGCAPVVALSAWVARAFASPFFPFLVLLQLSPVQLAPGASWTASQKLVPQ